MKVLLDNGVPRGLKAFLAAHEVIEARERGWDALANGKLIAAAEIDGFEVLLTNDKRIRYQQNLASRKIALVVLENAQWPMLKAVAATVAAAVDAARPGSYVEVPVPFWKRGRKES